ncbi:hypothetical protein [Pseudomonas frederiksbergensis]|uniref:Uncharacterized protein n=1 Tax=Pseudomonas frederiksbergensis TaxID=104087 RepID=A0A423KKS1_9PSED|nr:hypothetical protein [Pseudomonas frederiksbergensis]RON53983.1 hypothetical protein BK665_12970 [Pseudomonas frederiksbergensis]
MNIKYFDESIKPLMKGYSFKYAAFLEGDFGDLERVEFEGDNKVGGVEFWSKGWVGADVYDCVLDEQIFNVLLSPEESGLAEGMLFKMLESLGLKI